MPRALSSTSSLEKEPGDPLQGSLASLSLADTRETEEDENSPSRFNPFSTLSVSANDIGLLYPFENNFSLSARQGNSGQTVEDLTQKTIPRHVAQLQHLQQFTVNDTCDLYAQGRRFQQKWGILEESFLNWKTLLSGWMEFPAVMLLNPSPLDHIPFQDMVEMSDTLSWLQETLAGMHLSIDDVIIFDMFPMLRKDLLEATEQEGRAKRDELVQESFALTRASLALVRPRVLISCQCCTKPDNETWGFFDNKLARQLCSSLEGARTGRIQRLDVDEHQIQVVHGIHPNYVLKHRPELESVLLSRFAQIFKPYGVWKSRRAATEQELQDGGAMLLGLVSLLKKQIQIYSRLCEKAAGSGLKDRVGVGRAKELEVQLSVWE
ncbi:uncharacterized protein BDW70DRAFT_164825 [Aspergillus foveolatus]|uniref:uncharacterized protein n=1 Tax=Aspergillus foveolatus TaxID=210207 RepID=UPI003CCDA9BF